MPRTNTVIIGAGHAGLAMSWCLADRDIAHVVLDLVVVNDRRGSAGRCTGVISASQAVRG
jgi:cation diffusion facilitator CzcD-associated flavoprotein CzcO